MREAMMFTLGVVDKASTVVLGLDGRRPLRPLRLSVRTTEGTRRHARMYEDYMSPDTSFRQLQYRFQCRLQLAL